MAERVSANDERSSPRGSRDEDGNVRIGIIGGGFMGEAFLRGILRAHVAAPADIAIAEVVAARRAQLAEHGVRVTDDSESATIGADVVLLAVKPQDLPNVAASLQGALPREAVLISIAAGVRLDDVQRYSAHRATVRVMPNLPAAVGEGAAVFYAAGEVTPAQRQHVDAVLGAVARAVVEVHDDDALDLATAVHGSGPAYVYLFIESMIDAAVRLGMKRPEAQSLVLATVAGSARYAIESGEHPAALRNAVTSPGGTTAAALAELEAAGFRTAIDSAIEAAYERARELGE
ncbi:MAG: pyrroline-5-carboxylate reductase [Chloroflexi bacterium]|nr:MAG: pyrroline-5-carboxylate reductase [Chloroflexota bacterium]